MAEAADLSTRVVAAYPRLRGARTAIVALAEAVPVPPGPQYFADLALAWAAGLGDRDAQAELERGPLASGGQHLRGRGFAATVIDEALQATRVALLVAEAERRPAILGYHGRGPLVAFVRVALVRQALRIVAHTRVLVPLEDCLLATPDADDLELAHLRRTHGDDVRAAIGAAWAALARHDRFVLSLQLHGGLSVAEIATLYGQHRVSAARRLASARAALLAMTRIALCARLAASTATVDSLLRLVTSPLSAGALAPATGVARAVAAV